MFPSDRNGVRGRELEKRLAEQQAQILSFVDCLGGLANGLFFNDLSFRGFSVFLSRDGGFMAVAKRYSESGQPEIIFSSGATVWQAVTACDLAVDQGYWRDDKKAADYVAT